MLFFVKYFAIIVEQSDSNSKNVAFFVRYDKNTIISNNPPSLTCSLHCISFGKGYLFSNVLFLLISDKFLLFKSFSN